MKQQKKNKAIQTIRAFLLDFALLSYILLIVYKLVWEKHILLLSEMPFEWTDLLTIFYLSLPITLIQFFIPGFSVGKVVYMAAIPRYKIYRIWIYSALILTIYTGFVISQFSAREFFSPSGLEGAGRIFRSLLNPDFSIFNEALFAAVETIYMAFMATVIAIPFAFVLSFAAAKNLMNGTPALRFTYHFLRAILNFSRSIEPLIWAVIFSVWVGIGPFAGMLALMLHSIASLAKLYSEQIEGISEGPIEAIRSTGASYIYVLWYGVVQQVLLPYLSFTIYRWDINLRMATVIGLVGGGGIGTMLMQYQGLAKWRQVGLIVLVIAAIVWLMDYASAKIRENIK